MAAAQKMLQIGWKHLYARHCACTKLLPLHQRSGIWRSQMTYERQQSRRQQMCRTCFCVAAFNITKRVLHLELTSSPSPGRAKCRTHCPAPSSARKRFPNNFKQASLDIWSSNGYSSMVLCTRRKLCIWEPSGCSAYSGVQIPKPMQGHIPLCHGDL